MTDEEQTPVSPEEEEPKASEPEGDDSATQPDGKREERDSQRWKYLAALIITAVVTIAVVALLINIFERRHEPITFEDRVVDVDEDTIDPAVWGQNWPRQFETYSLTVDYEQTRYGGSDAIPEQKLDKDPWLRLMWSGYAFALDYREARGHAYMLIDQEETERVLQRPQPGACLHCHSSVLPAYRFMGDGDLWEGFRIVNSMGYEEARNLTDDEGELLIDHPLACVDCHNPDTMQVRITRPAFKAGITDYMDNVHGISDYDVNRDATRQEMRTYVCAQCHVEYYFTPDDNQLVYPWSRGLDVDAQEEYYDAIDFADWEHGYTGARVLKAQHPEFELFSQGPHANAGVSCADCHMPYEREGAIKFTNHHVRSPLLHMDNSCMTCHGGSEEELLERVHTIQDRTQALTDRSADALVQLMHQIVAAQESGADPEELQPALDYQRKAQWRLDWIYSENSHGFHAPQESARVLADSIDYSRRGIQIAQELSEIDIEDIQRVPEELEGVTPAEEAPPGVYE